MRAELLGKYIIIQFLRGVMDYYKEDGILQTFNTFDSAQAAVGINEFEQSYIVQIVQDAEYDDNGDCTKWRVLDSHKQTEKAGLRFAVGKL